MYSSIHLMIHQKFITLFNSYKNQIISEFSFEKNQTISRNGNKTLDSIGIQL
jgi:hypothetical protein